MFRFTIRDVLEDLGSRKFAWPVGLACGAWVILAGAQVLQVYYWENVTVWLPLLLLLWPLFFAITLVVAYFCVRLSRHQQFGHGFPAWMKSYLGEGFLRNAGQSREAVGIALPWAIAAQGLLAAVIIVCIVLSEGF